MRTWSKAQKLRRSINESFRDRLDPAFKTQFGRELKTEFSLLNMTLVSRPVDGKKLTKAQASWIETFSAGYHAAMEQVR